MKTLLAIVQDPKESKDFLRYVAGMAIDLGAKVKVHNVVKPANHSIGMADATTGHASLELKRNQEMLLDESKKILNDYTNAVNKDVSNQVFVESTAEIGTATVVVNDLVDKKLVDMVVLENEKDNGFWSQTTENMDIINKAKCPVWIIPKGAVYKPFTEIVYACDYKKEDITILKKLITTFPHYSPNITALHITDSIDFEERVKKAGFVEVLQKQTDYKPLKVRAIYQSKDDDLTEVINEYALKNGTDLLVLLKENKSFFERIYKTSQTKEILKSTNLPVLVYHEK